VPAAWLVKLPLELPLSERPDARERIVQKEDKMKSQPRTNARTTRRVGLRILGTVLCLIGSFCLFTSTALAATDFGLSVSPGTLNLAPGTSNSYTLTFSPTPGTTTNLSVSALPSGVTSNFPTSVGAGTTSTLLTLTATTAAPPGNYPLTITAADTSGSQTPGVTLVVVGPVPFIDSISPLSAAPGGSGFTLTLYGGGFISGFSQIYWNGAALSGTTTCATTYCTVSVPAGNIATPGTAFVTVVDPGQNGGISNVFFFPIIGSTPKVSFSRTDFSAGNGLSSVAVAAFTSSGFFDLAVANRDDNTVSILLGNGDGTFKTQTTFATGYTPVSVAVGDFNNDGYLDLAVVNTCGSTLSCTSATTGTVSILLGDGTGNFTLHSSSPITGAGSNFVAVGDFNGDGNLDLAVANGTDGDLSILLGNGDGTFTLKSNPPTDPNPSWVAVGDFNNDGILDLAVANAGTTTTRGDTVTVMIGNGDGTFSTSSISSQGLSPVAVAVGDFNRDGNLDLAVANACGTDTSCSSVGEAAILTGDGAGSFTLASNTAAGSGPSALAVADLNGDGKLDVAVADGTGSAVSILLGDGTGNLSLQTSPASPSTGSNPSSLAVGDFNLDGGMDLVTANKNATTVTVLLEAPTVTLACGSSQPSGTTCTLSPAPSFAPNLSFGNEPEGSAVGPMTVTLTNSSNLTLTVTSLAVTSGATNFAFDSASTTCGAVPFVPPLILQGGANCTIGVNFKPTSASVLSGFIQIGDNAPGSPQNINLKGTGTAAAASVSPTTLPFGNVSVPGPSAAQTVKLSNTGAAPLTITSYSATSPFTAQPNGTDGSTCGSSLPAVSSCYIAITFSPSTAGFQSGTLSIMDTNGVTSLTQTVSLSGTGIQAVASATPGSLSFTNQDFGFISVAQPVTLSNTGAGTLSTISISITGTNASEFAQTNNCGTSVPGYSNCTIYVTFTPSVTGSTQTATLSITDNAGSQPVSLMGMGIKANTYSMITLNTPNQSMVGLTVTVNFTVTASPPGIGTPTGTVMVSDGTGDSCTGSLTAGAGSCSVPILTPSSPGPKPLTASYLGDSNFNTSISPAVPQVVTRANTTTTITSAIPSSSVVGQPVTVSFKVEPPTGDILTPTGTVTVSDGAGDSCMGTLNGSATGSCILTPTTPGAKTLTASYSGDWNFKPSVGSLTNGLAAVVDFSISVAPTKESVSPATTTTSKLILTLTSLGGFTGTVSLTCSDPQYLATTCTLVPNSVLLSGTYPVTVLVKVDKGAAPLTFTLTFTGKFGSGSPLTGGLTHSTSARITIK
jgi:hypothetical protein